MTGILKQVKTMLPEVYEKAKLNANDFLAILQGLTGFVSSIASKDPFGFIDSALGVAESQLGKQCLKTLEGYLGSIRKWLTFGKNYNSLKDSSDLDFDKVEVDSVPEIMQVLHKKCDIFNENNLSSLKWISVTHILYGISLWSLVWVYSEWRSMETALQVN